MQALLGVRGNGLCRDFACHARRPLAFFNDFNRPSKVLSLMVRLRCESRDVNLGADSGRTFGTLVTSNGDLFIHVCYEDCLRKLELLVCHTQPQNRFRGFV